MKTQNSAAAAASFNCPPLPPPFTGRGCPSANLSPPTPPTIPLVGAAPPCRDGGVVPAGRVVDKVKREQCVKLRRLRSVGVGGGGGQSCRRRLIRSTIFCGRPAGRLLQGKYHLKKYLPNIAQNLLKKSIPPTEVSGDIWSIFFGRAIFGRSRHLKYRQNIASNFATRWA